MVDPEITARYLKNLQAPLGVYGVLGNHDWWYNGNRVRAAFESAGIPYSRMMSRNLIGTASHSGLQASQIYGRGPAYRGHDSTKRRRDQP
jgi:predicted MPP superfamily phosphohydrolase